jgi:site-specific recombinase XerD
MLHFRSKPLPELAESFLKELLASGRGKNTISMYRAALHHFHRFLAQQRITIQGFDEKMLLEYDEDLQRHNLKLVTRRASIGQLHIYLRWLESRGEIQLGLSKRLFPKYRADVVKGQQAELPELALRFLSVLAATNKKNTVNGYQSGLRSFYRLHQMRTHRSYEITRRDIEDLAIHLKDRGMAANERFMRMIQLRRYLEWLHEHGKIKTPPDFLVRQTDLPKREERLPRPFPVNVDMEVQRRLDENGSIDYLGILLMRRCGLRVGELRDLTLDCITTDFNENWFLKVPLGKLNNERIIPLDPKTVEVVKRIQAFHSGRTEPGSAQKYLISNPSGRRRSQTHFGGVLREVTLNMAIPGAVNLHRLRHSFATSLLSAGLSITTLKKLLGHRDIRMTLNYAAVTQETIRNEYFGALSKIQSKYEVAAYPLKLPDLREGMNRGFYDAQKYAKKIAGDRAEIDQDKLKRLCGRMMALRQELSDLLR